MEAAGRGYEKASRSRYQLRMPTVTFKGLISHGQNFSGIATKDFLKHCIRDQGNFVSAGNIQLFCIAGTNSQHAGRDILAGVQLSGHGSEFIPQRIKAC